MLINELSLKMNLMFNTFPSGQTEHIGAYCYSILYMLHPNNREKEAQ